MQYLPHSRAEAAHCPRSQYYIVIASDTQICSKLTVFMSGTARVMVVRSWYRTSGNGLNLGRRLSFLSKDIHATFDDRWFVSFPKLSPSILPLSLVLGIFCISFRGLRRSYGRLIAILLWAPFILVALIFLAVSPGLSFPDRSLRHCRSTSCNHPDF